MARLREGLAPLLVFASGTCACLLLWLLEACSFPIVDRFRRRRCLDLFLQTVDSALLLFHRQVRLLVRIIVDPTSREVKSLRLLLGFSQADLGIFAGKRVTKKGCSHVRLWETDDSKPEHPI